MYVSLTPERVPHQPLPGVLLRLAEGDVRVPVHRPGFGGRGPDAREGTRKDLLVWQGLSKHD